MTAEEYMKLDIEDPARKEYNKELLGKFPWLIPRNEYTDEVVDDYDYDFTILDDMPRGWRIAFGEQMCQEIHDELVKWNSVDAYRIDQIKEKFGGLRWYDRDYNHSKYGLCNHTVYLDECKCPDYDWKTEEWRFNGCENGKFRYDHYPVIDRCKIPDIISKYEDISFQTCIVCGKPATIQTLGWITYLCHDCYVKMEKNNDRTR